MTEIIHEEARISACRKMGARRQACIFPVAPLPDSPRLPGFPVK